MKYEWKSITYQHFYSLVDEMYCKGNFSNIVEEIVKKQLLLAFSEQADLTKSYEMKFMKYVLYEKEIRCVECYLFFREIRTQ